MFPGGAGITDPISREAKWERMPASNRTTEYYLKPGESRVTARAAAGWARGSRLAKVAGVRQAMSE